MKTLTQRLLNDFQREFPLNPEPFERIARELDISTGSLERTARLPASKPSGIFFSHRAHRIGL